MKCYYCQSETDRITRLIQVCDICPVERIIYMFKKDPSEENIDPWLVQFEVRCPEYNILLCLDIQEHTFTSYLLNKTRTKDDLLISLDYLPDINPNNAKEWADRFYKLRTFL